MLFYVLASGRIYIIYRVEVYRKEVYHLLNRYPSGGKKSFYLDEALSMYVCVCVCVCVCARTCAWRIVEVVQDNKYFEGEETLS